MQIKQIARIRMLAALLLLSPPVHATPDAFDSTIIQGVNTAGTIRLNCLANLEALINVFANLAELCGLGICIFLLFRTIRKMTSKQRFLATFRALSVAALSFFIPGALSCVLALMRDYNLLS